MAEHSTGPWSVSPGYCQRGKWAGHRAIYPEGGPPLAYLPKGREDIQEANARLIAAAPETAAERDRLKEINADLLAALEQLVGTIKPFEAKLVKEFSAIGATQTNMPAMDKARAAIAKARGTEGA